MTHRAALLFITAAALAGCGGGDSPLGNPPSVQNPAGSGGRKLSFVYFQKCIEPILQTPITSSSGTNTCASAGCHDTAPPWSTSATRPTRPTSCA
jgi:hypothetical protein